jgi:CheY-like chemotaxis protein
LFTHLDFKVWINGEMFRLIRAIFQGERIKNADVFALFPPAIRFFSDVAETVGLNRVPEDFGYTVLTALSGGKGLEVASMYSVDVVIVDYCMPEMNGHEVAIEMRRLKPKAPIIMLSAALDVPEQAMKLVDAFVAKDRLASQLLPAIAQLHRRGSTAQPSYDT